MDIRNSCRCCLMRPPDKNIKKPYMREGKTEIYSNMLKECFEIHLTFLPSDNECGICVVCVGRLQDAADFKLQVQRSQDMLRAQVHSANIKAEESPKPEKTEELPKAEKLDNYYAAAGSEELIMHNTVEVKMEIMDPLPTDDNEEFGHFVTDLKNQSPAVCKQEPLFEVPVNNQIESSFFTTQEGFINEAFDHDIKRDLKPIEKQLSKNKNAPYTCDICRRHFKLKVGLSIHKQTHTRGAFVCEICNKQFKFQNRLNRHRQVHVGDKHHQCKQCNKLFRSKHTLRKHRRTHLGETSFTCGLCKRGYKKKQDLVSHIRLVHSGIERYHCKLCPVKVKFYGTLVKHIKNEHTTPSSYTCDECNTVFHSKSALITHMNMHFKWYTCELCGIALSTRNNLRRHKLIHTGEKSYSCETCNKQFRYKHGLKNHMTTHTGEKSHCCEICGKQFSQKTNLKKHLQIHVEGQIFPCELCTKSYSTSEGLRQHRRTHTKNKTQGKSVSKRKKQKEIYIHDFN